MNKHDKLSDIIKSGNLENLKSFLEKSSNFNIHIHDYIFRYACRFGQLNIVKYFLKKFP